MSIKFDKSDPDEIFRSEEHNEEVYRREKNEEEARKRRRGEMPEEKKPKTVNYIHLTDDVWDTLVAAANKQGDNVAQFCADIISAAVEDIEKTMSSRSFKLSGLRRRARTHLENMTALEAIAMEYGSNPSPELAEILVSMCDELGKNPEEIKHKAINDPMAEEIANFNVNPGTKTALCKKFMIDLMRRNDYRISAHEGNKAGTPTFTKDMMAQTRRKLGIDSVIDAATGIHYWVVTKQAKAAQTILGGGKNEWEISD